MATTTKTSSKPAETPTERLDRQEAEYQSYLREHETVGARLAQLKKDLTTAAEQDDTDKVLAIAKERDNLGARLKELDQLIEAKALAAQTTRRQLAEATRAANIKLAQAQIATAVDIAPALEQSVFDTVDFIRRFADQLAGARKAIIDLGDGSPGSCPMPTHHGLAAWIVNQLVSAGLPITATCRDAWGNSTGVSGPGVAPVELVERATAIVETIR